MGQDASPSVTLKMLEESVLKANGDEQSPRYGRNLEYLLSTHASRLSISYKEYLASGIKVGDRVLVEVTRSKEGAAESVAKLLESTRKSKAY